MPRVLQNRHPTEQISADNLKVADEVWIATALLHREHPDREDFTVREIISRLAKEAATGEVRAGVRPHILLHCVANRPPNPGRYRMLFATGRLTRRLYRPGDPYHPGRRGSKTVPDRTEIPTRYHPLLAWYQEDYAGREKARSGSILELAGLGKEIWEGVDPDEYVRELREGWE